jgi:hypothetical protein
MIEFDYLPLTADELPVSKIFTLGDNQYNFTFRKNTKYDRIYCEVCDLDDVLLYTTRLVYGGSLLHAEVDGLVIDDPIVPFDISDLLTDKVGEIDVTSLNLDTVKLYAVA